MMLYVCVFGVFMITTGFSISPLQQVQDTPEVTAAKEAHFAAVAKAKSEARMRDNSFFSSKNERLSSQMNFVEWWNGIRSDSVQKSDQLVSNHVKNVYSKSSSGNLVFWNKSNEESKWKGPVALPPGYDETGAPLPVQDTPEVADAKAKHFRALALAISPGPAMIAQQVVSTTPNSITPVLRNTMPALFTPISTHFNDTREILSTPPLLVNFGITNSLQQQDRVKPREPAPIWEEQER